MILVVKLEDYLKQLIIFTLYSVKTADNLAFLKEDIMDVEPCYPLFSAELESADALASSQQKF